MINGKFTHNLKSSFLITVFSLFIFTACGGCGSVPETPPLKVGDNKKSADTKKTPDKAPEKKINFKKVIVLFHGLGVPGDSGIAALREKLKNDIKNSEIIILDRNNSGSVPTTQQAGEAYQDLKRQLEQRQLAGSPICLIGDSHGGLVALELYRQYKDDLNIVGIVTNHSPLEGAPGVNDIDDEIKNFKNTIKNVLESMESFQTLMGMNLDINGLSNKIDSLPLKEMLTGKIQQPVKDDLLGKNDLLNNVRRTLSSIPIPVLVLAGHADILTNVISLLGFASQDKTFGQNLGKVRNILIGLQKKKNTMQIPPFFKPIMDNMFNSLEDTFGKIIGDKKNDSFLPYYSQSAEHISVSPSVKRYSKEGYDHFYGMQNHSEVYGNIVRFINQAFENKK